MRFELQVGIPSPCIFYTGFIFKQKRKELEKEEERNKKKR